ncbi:hypothetical protein V8E53_014339 [Lactarius tabidus]
MLRVRSRTEREYATVIVVRKTEKSPSRRREATTTETETAEGGTVATGWGDVTKAMRGGDGTTGEWAHSRSRPLGRHSMREDQRDNDKEDCPHETAETATAGISPERIPHRLDRTVTDMPFEHPLGFKQHAVIKCANAELAPLMLRRVFILASPCFARSLPPGNSANRKQDQSRSGYSPFERSLSGVTCLRSVTCPAPAYLRPSNSNGGRDTAVCVIETKHCGSTTRSTTFILYPITF